MLKVIKTYILNIIILIPFTVLGQNSYGSSPADSLKLKNDTIRIVKKTRKFIVDTIPDVIYKDTTLYKYIKPDTTKKNISNFIIKQLFRDVKPVIANKDIDNSLIKVTKFNEFDGYIIDSIVIDRNDVFDNEYIADKRNGRIFRKIANGLHATTKESTIKRYLLFKKNDVISPELMTKSEAMLRDASMISDANIEVVPTGEDGHAIVYVRTTDTWSIDIDFSYRYSNNGHITLSENNFLGLGHRFDVTEYFNMRRKEYFRATELVYNMTNIGGSFINLKVGGGIGIDYASIIAQTDKQFIKRDDYAFGIRYNLKKDEIEIPMDNYFTLVNRREMSLWWGKSFKLSSKWGDNIFFALKAEDIKHDERPYISSYYNSYFHNSLDVLASTGFYKEKFYRGNMIYGYGRTEAISYGYKAEVIGGYRWGEFYNAPYFGARLSMGNMLKLGYLSANISAGSFWDGKDKKFKQAKINASILCFSRLHHLGSDYYLRQFFRINYNGGFNLINGYDDYITFNNRNKLASASDKIYGSTHLAFNPESVFFTPLHVYGFRFAFFGFVDMGTIGHNSNPFKNHFFATTGIGVRVRNESLIFNTIQFRLVIGVKTHDNYRNSLFNINAEPSLRTNSYVPTDPRIVKYNMY